MSRDVPRLVIHEFLFAVTGNVGNGRNCCQSAVFLLRPPAIPLYTSAAIIHVSRADRVRQILSTRGLTLYQASRHSAEMFGRSSPYYLPHHLYSNLAAPLRCPSIHQVVALSRISNYRLRDWLAVLGFHLEDIPRLQSLLPLKRTVVLDSSVYDENFLIPWFAEKLPPERIPGIAPLGYFLESGPPRRAKALRSLNRKAFLYAKLGGDDRLAFPDLTAGSIVRIDPSRAAERLPDTATGPSRQIFLVEHDSVLRCGRLQRNTKGRTVLCSVKFPFSRIDLNSDPAFRVYGVVDAEMRALTHPELFCQAPAFVNATAPREAPRTSSGARALGELIRCSRIRAGFSFREASALSRRIGEVLADEMYFTAVGTLSEYETLTHPPRHVQKIISICTLFNIGFWDFLRVSSLPIDSLGGEPIPDEFVCPPGSRSNQGSWENETAGDTGKGKAGFLSGLIDQWEEIPLFVKDAMAGLSGIRDLSMRDVFWVGGERNAIHPYLENAAFVVVNRRLKKPVKTTARTVWEQPLYVLLKRDGGFLCGACTLERGVLSIHPYPDRSVAFRQLRSGIDAEVIGRGMTIVRRLP
jgi:hypothetical protein